MNDKEIFEFDRQGYIVIKNMLTSDSVASLAAALDALEEHALAHVDQPPRKTSSWGANSHVSSRGYHAHGSDEAGQTLIIEDYWNADPAFDILVNHERTMEYVHGVVKERSTINITDQVRKTLHVGYGPHWLPSQNVSTMDETQYITAETAARFDDEQNALFRAAVLRQ